MLKAHSRVEESPARDPVPLVTKPSMHSSDHWPATASPHYLRRAFHPIWKQPELQRTRRFPLQSVRHEIRAVLAEKLSSPLSNGKQPNDSLLRFYAILAR